MRKTSRLLLALVIVAACGGGDSTAPQTTTTTGGTTGGTGGTGGNGGNGAPTLSGSVTVGDNMFSPGSVTVLKGGTVTWTFSTGTGHTVTFDDGTGTSLMTGGSYSKSFPNAGTFNYQCTQHYGMYGTVVVQ
jgi:plastocyanin